MKTTLLTIAFIILASSGFTQAVFTFDSCIVNCVRPFGTDSTEANITAVGHTYALIDGFKEPFPYTKTLKIVLSQKLNDYEKQEIYEREAKAVFGPEGDPLAIFTFDTCIVNCVRPINTDSTEASLTAVGYTYILVDGEKENFPYTKPLFIVLSKTLTDIEKEAIYEERAKKVFGK